MQVAVIGLGRMGMNMARRLLQGGHSVVVYNRTHQKTDQMVREGAEGAYDLRELTAALSPPRTVWMMLPAGAAIDMHIHQLKELLSEGDIVIDGANTWYKDDIRREKVLSQMRIRFMDVGVSGGIWGLEIGYCLMIGGDNPTFRFLEPVFKTLAPDGGYLYCGPVGAGHFVKMIHNGIEYGMMQAYGEGFQLLDASEYKRFFNYADICRLWNTGSVVRSWLLELAQKAFADDPKLHRIKGYVDDSGEGRWTIQYAVEAGIAAPVIALSLFNRFSSRQSDSFTNRVLAALRREFGGHAAMTSGPKDQ